MANITEEMIYAAFDAATKVYSGTLKPTEAVTYLSDAKGMNRKSATAYMHALRHLFRGDKYTRRISNLSSEIFLGNISYEFGREGLSKALKAMGEHADYLENTRTGQLQPGLRKIIDRYKSLLTDPTEDREFHQEFENDVKNALAFSLEELAAKMKQKDHRVQTKKVISTVFVRNPFVKAFALRRANGTCEFCGCQGPFKKPENDTPYLEVHHRKPLAEGGSDIIENVLAVCPNCHREAHFGSEKEKFRV